MNSTQATSLQTAKSRSSDPKPKSTFQQTQGDAESASKQADAAAKRGEPLPANKPGERSPKQENL